MDFYTCFTLFLFLFFLSFLCFLNGDVIDIEDYIDVSTWVSQGLLTVSLSHCGIGIATPPTHSHPPSLLFLKLLSSVSVHGTMMHTATHSRKGESTTATAKLLSYTAPRWETSAALQHYLSVQLSPLHYSQNILVTLASWNSQLCLLHSLSSVCVQSFCAAAWELYPSKKLGLGGIGQPRGSPC